MKTIKNRRISVCRSHFSLSKPWMSRTFKLRSIKKSSTPGENALEFDLATGTWAFDQMSKQIRTFALGLELLSKHQTARLTALKP